MYPFTATIDLTGEVKTVSGWNIAENAGSAAAARVLLRNGGSAGPIFADIRIPESGSSHESFYRALSFPSGLYVEVGAGTVRGAIVSG